MKRTTDAGESWSIDATISEPVTFSAHGEGATIDEAAHQVIDQLRMVGVTID